jgi:hypothetical protein
MIKKFICWLFGHKFVAKVFTGEVQTVSTYGGHCDVEYYKWVRYPFCLKCGKTNPDFKEGNNVAPK